MKNLNREIAKLGRNSMAGLIKGGILIIRDTDKTAPVIPVDLGNLRASRYMVTGLGSNKEPTPQFKGNDSGKLKSYNEIDQQVYKLYSLTKTEIKVVEDSLK